MDWKSDDIGAISEALAKAQSEIKPVKKDAKNPFFNSKYAPLDSVREACKEALSTNNISVIQRLRTERVEAKVLNKSGSAVIVSAREVSIQTILTHSSGQWLSDEWVSATAKDESPQSVGSGITYLRRYSLSAMLGITPESDDDGESAQIRQNGKKPIPEPIIHPKDKPSIAKKPQNATVTQSKPEPIPEQPKSDKVAEIVNMASEVFEGEAETPYVDSVVDDNGNETKVVNIKKSYEATGERNGKTWTRIDFYCDEMEGKLSSFSDSVIGAVQLAESSGRPLAVSYQVSDYKGKPQYNVVKAEVI